VPIPNLHSTPPLGEFPSEYRHPVWHRKTRMTWLSDGEKNSKIFLFFLAQLTNVTDGHTDRQTPHDGIGCAYASHRAAISELSIKCASKAVKSRRVCCNYECYNRLPIWLSRNALVSINVVTLRQTRLVPGWVTVYRTCKPSRRRTRHPGLFSLSHPSVGRRSE